MKERERDLKKEKEKEKMKNAIDFCCKFSELLQQVEGVIEPHVSCVFTIHPSLHAWPLSNHHHHHHKSTKP